MCQYGIGLPKSIQMRIRIRIYGPYTDPYTDSLSILEVNPTIDVPSNMDDCHQLLNIPIKHPFNGGIMGAITLCRSNPNQPFDQHDIKKVSASCGQFSQLITWLQNHDSRNTADTQKRRLNDMISLIAYTSRQGALERQSPLEIFDELLTLARSSLGDIRTRIRTRI